MSIAVTTYRVGYVFFKGNKLTAWGSSAKATKSPQAALRIADKWIVKLEPQVLITERVGLRTRKGERSVSIIEAITSMASAAPLNDLSIPRIRQFQNKYQEAEAIGERFPIISHLVPAQKPRLWESEPKQMIYFEAIVLALGVISTEQLGGNKSLFAA